MTIRSLSSFAAVVLLSTLASAQERQGQPVKAEMHSACREDVKKFCPDVKPGSGRIIECLKAHESELSEGCRAVGERMKAHLAEFKAACGADVEKFCPGAEPGDGRLRDCLHGHQAEVSDSCRAFFHDHAGPRHQAE